MRYSVLRTVRLILLGFVSAVFTAVSFGVGHAHAAGTTVDSRLKLQVEALDCTVDIVDSGTGQTLQIPAHSCLPIVPKILTPVLDEDPVPALPPLAQSPVVPVIVPSPSVPRGGDWSPITSTTAASQPYRQSSAVVVPATVVSLGVVITATAVGFDAALFELSHSKSTVRWIRSRVRLPVPRW